MAAFMIEAQVGQTAKKAENEGRVSFDGNLGGDKNKEESGSNDSTSDVKRRNPKLRAHGTDCSHLMKSS